MKGLNNIQQIIIWLFWTFFLIFFTSTLSFSADKFFSNNEEIKKQAKIDFKSFIKNESIFSKSKLDSIFNKKEEVYKGFFLAEYTNHLLSKNNLSNINEIISKTISIFEKMNCPSGKADIYFIAGKFAITQNNHENILASFNEAAKNYELTNNSKGVIFSQIRIANYFSKNNNYQIADRYYQLAISFLDKELDSKTKELVYFNVANHYNKVCEFDKALKYYLELEKRISNNKQHPRLSLLYNNLGVLYLRKEQWTKAEYYLNKSLDIKISQNNTKDLIYTYQNLYSISIRTRNIKKCNHYHNIISRIIDSSSISQDLLMDYKFNVINHLILKKDVDSTLAQLEDFITIKDSLSNIAFSDKLIEMQKSFEMQEKDREIELLQKEDALQKARLNNQRLIIILSLALLILLGVIGVLINRQRRRLKKSQKILKQRKQEIININEKLKLSNQSKDRILSVIGHDLRGPVGGLKELIELYIELGEFEQEDVLNLLNAARESSTSTYHLLENLLSWANAQRGQIEFNPEYTAIQPLVYHTVHLLDNSVNTRNIRFKCDVAEDLHLEVDQNMLSTIVRNLVSNAIKFSPEDGLVSVIVTEQEEDVIFCIADEGIGFSAKESENLFTHKETYFLDKSNSAKGTGLGLILCKEFVERHGGRIWTESNLKKGAKICFNIPKTIQQPSSPKTKQAVTVSN